MLYSETAKELLFSRAETGRRGDCEEAKSSRFACEKSFDTSKSR